MYVCILGRIYLHIYKISIFLDKEGIHIKHKWRNRKLPASPNHLPVNILGFSGEKKTSIIFHHCQLKHSTC